MNVATAFEALHQDLNYLARTASVKKIRVLQSVLDDSLDTYQIGETICSAY